MSTFYRLEFKYLIYIFLILKLCQPQPIPKTNSTQVNVPNSKPANDSLKIEGEGPIKKAVLNQEKGIQTQELKNLSSVTSSKVNDPPASNMVIENNANLGSITNASIVHEPTIKKVTVLELEKTSPKPSIEDESKKVSTSVPSNNAMVSETLNPVKNVAKENQSISIPETKEEENSKSKVKEEPLLPLPDNEFTFSTQKMKEQKEKTASNTDINNEKDNIKYGKEEKNNENEPYQYTDENYQNSQNVPLNNYQNENAEKEVIELQKTVFPNKSYEIYDDANSHFFAYFLTMMVMAVIFYLLFHNKQRIIALMIEGRGGQSKRRSSRARYHKLDNNLEEAMSSTRGLGGSLGSVY